MDAKDVAEAGPAGPETAAVETILLIPREDSPNLSAELGRALWTVKYWAIKGVHGRPVHLWRKTRLRQEPHDSLRTRSAPDSLLGNVLTQLS